MEGIRKRVTQGAITVALLTGLGYYQFTKVREWTYDYTLRGAEVVPDVNSDCKPELKVNGLDGRPELWISTPTGLVPYDQYRASQVGEKELGPLDRRVKKVLK